MSLEDWLKPSNVGADDDDDVVGNPMGSDGIIHDAEDLPDLGLGSLSAEDIKWVDLEFLDLASGPPANQEKNRNKNPTLGYNFPDIFFGDATSSSLFNTNFSIDDLKPFGDSFKDTALDLECVEKGILADLFPPSAQEDFIPTNTADTQNVTTSTSSAIVGDPSSDSIIHESNSILQNSTTTVVENQIKKGQTNILKDGVYSIPADILDAVWRRSRSSTSEEEQEDEEDEEDEIGKKDETSSPFRILGVVKPGEFLTNPEEPDSMKIAIQFEKISGSTMITVLPDLQKEGRTPQSIGQTFRVLPENLQKVLSAIKPVNLNGPPLKKAVGSFEEPAAVENRRCEEDNSTQLQFKDIKLVTDQTSVRKLAEHGIELGGMACATAENGQKYWICPERGCEKAYTRPSKLKIHLLAHKEIKPFKCHILNCTWAFVTNSKLQRHLLSHRKLKSFKCTLNGCSKSFSTIYNLHKHLKLHERPPQFKCDICQNTYAKEKLFVAHLKSHGNEVTPGHECHEDAGCNERFFSLTELKSHRKNFHSGEDITNSVCSECGKSFKKPSQLNAHFRTHSKMRPFNCPYKDCSWSFATASKLKRHERSHQNIRSHVCPICHKSYLRSEHLKGHVASHNLARTFLCPFEFCLLRFDSKQALQDHVVSSHKHNNTKERFRCIIENCRKQSQPFFFSSLELGHHLGACHKAEFAQFDIVSMINSSNVNNNMNSKTTKKVHSAILLNPLSLKDKNILNNLKNFEVIKLENSKLVTAGNSSKKSCMISQIIIPKNSKSISNLRPFLKASTITLRNGMSRC